MHAAALVCGCDDLYLECVGCVIEDLAIALDRAEPFVPDPVALDRAELFVADAVLDRVELLSARNSVVIAVLHRA